MKTKTNKVPLVGPKGRKKLLDRIEELEKEVLALAQSGGNSPKPIRLTESLGNEETIESLAEKGLTVQEIEAASRGELTSIIIPDSGVMCYFSITYVTYADESNYSIAFENYSRNSGFEINTGTSYYINVVDGQLDVYSKAEF